MKLTSSLLARLQRFTRKSDAPDAFDLRLQRIGSRERRRAVKPFLFRSLLQPMEAAVQP